MIYQNSQKKAIYLLSLLLTSSLFLISATKESLISLILFSLSCCQLLKLFGEKGLIKSVNVFPANIKSINPLQKYPHIIESYACILNIFAFIVLLPITF